MPRDRKTIGACPTCETGEVTCTHNHFETDDECIDSWEHRCLDCSYRETQAFHGDDAEDEGDPNVCPFCGRGGAVG